MHGEYKVKMNIKYILFIYDSLNATPSTWHSMCMVSAHWMQAAVADFNTQYSTACAHRSRTPSDRTVGLWADIWTRDLQPTMVLQVILIFSKDDEQDKNSF